MSYGQMLEELRSLGVILAQEPYEKDLLLADWLTVETRLQAVLAEVSRRKAMRARERSQWGEANTSLYGGWPLTPCERFGHKELALECPFCKGRNIVLTSEPNGPGTGPMGRHRLGDPARDLARCSDCGQRGYHGETNLPKTR